MRKLQAAMKDAAAKSWRWRRLMYRVGSVFKGCHYCGDWEPWSDDSDKKRYTSGFQVFRAFNPKAMGWTFWCWECGSKDRACWEGAENIGVPHHKVPEDLSHDPKCGIYKRQPCSCSKGQEEKPKFFKKKRHSTEINEQANELRRKIAELEAKLRG